MQVVVDGYQAMERNTLLHFSSSIEKLLPFPFPTEYAWVMTISIEYEI